MLPKLIETDCFLDIPYQIFKQGFMNYKTFVIVNKNPITMESAKAWTKRAARVNAKAIILDSEFERQKREKSRN